MELPFSSNKYIIINIYCFTVSGNKYLCRFKPLSVCPAGSYINEENSNNCDPCPQGSFTNETNSTSCTPCPSGTMTSSNGSTSCCEYGEYGFIWPTVSIRRCVRISEIILAVWCDIYLRPDIFIQMQVSSLTYFIVSEL